MTEFTSEIKKIPYNETIVYEVLSDLNNLEKIKDRIPQDKIQDFSFDRDSCTFHVSSVGNVRFSVVEREPNTTIKFKSDQLPIDIYMWIQLKEVNHRNTRLKLTVKAKLNPFLKPMLFGPLQRTVEQIAGVLAIIPYETLGKEHKG